MNLNNRNGTIHHLHPGPLSSGDNLPVKSGILSEIHRAVDAGARRLGLVQKFKRQQPGHKLRPEMNDADFAAFMAAKKLEEEK